MTLTDVPPELTRSPAKLAVELTDVSKVYPSGRGTVAALERINLTVASGSFTCVVGASGCGKSTLLNLLAGVDTATAGTVRVDGRSGLMFQESALFPWLTVAGNVGLPLKLRGAGRRERAMRVQQLLELVHLGDFARRRPHELSGGMRQRVALARALAQDAEVLLMDEPFGALDAMTRDVLHDELERIWQQTGATIVFVTHNVREAARLGDEVIVLTSRPGRVADRLAVDLPRPRRIEDRGVGELASQITHRLRQEVARHAHRR